jgi:hypothetical protein
MHALRAKGCLVSGIDLSPGAVSSARAKGLEVLHGDVDMFETDAAIGSLLTARYDTVIFSKCLSHLRSRNVLMPALNTDCILINQRNRSHWKEVVRRLAGRPSAARDNGPYLNPSGEEIPQKSLGDLRRWGESYGFASKVLLGSALRSKDAVIMLYR